MLQVLEVFGDATNHLFVCFRHLADVKLRSINFNRLNPFQLSHLTKGILISAGSYQALVPCSNPCNNYINSISKSFIISSDDHRLFTV